MVDYLTQDDVDNYGPELINVTQRAALQAVAPHLQNLESQNAQLRQRMAIEARRNLDQQIASAVPNYQEVDRDPRWHRWLLGVDTLSGRIRQHLLNDAITAGDARRVKSFFDSFQQEAAGRHPPRGQLPAGPGWRPANRFTPEIKSASSIGGISRARMPAAKPSGRGRRPTSSQPVAKGAFVTRWIVRRK